MTVVGNLLQVSTKKNACSVFVLPIPKDNLTVNDKPGSYLNQKKKGKNRNCTRLLQGSQTGRQHPL